MKQEQSKHDHARERRRKQRDTASEESKAKERVWQILAQHFAHFLKRFRPLLCCLHLHATRGCNRYPLAYFRIFFCARHTLRMRIPSFRHAIINCIMITTTKGGVRSKVCWLIIEFTARYMSLIPILVLRDNVKHTNTDATWQGLMVLSPVGHPPSNPKC